MPNNPSNDNPVESIIEFKGLNDQFDSVARPKGTVTSNQNILDEQIFDANRRHGRTFDRLESESIRFIYDFTWSDGGINFGYGAGSNGNNDTVRFPNRNINQTNPSIPGPMPNYAFSLPILRNPPQLPDFSSYVRAVSDARRFVSSGVDSLSWDDQVWALDFYEVDEDGNATLVKENVRTKSEAMSYLSAGYRYRKNFTYPSVAAPNPATGMPDDFYWVDYFCQFGLVSIRLDNIINNYNTVKNSYVKTAPPFENVSSVNNFTNADNYNPGTITYESTDSTYWVTVANQLAKLINSNLSYTKTSGSETTFVQKSYRGAVAFLYPTDAGALACVSAQFPGTAWIPNAGPFTQYASPGCSAFSLTSNTAVNYAATFVKISPSAFGTVAARYINVRSKVSCDLTGYSYGTGTPFVYFLLIKYFDASTTFFGQIRPTTSDVNTYGRYWDFYPLLGQSVTSNFITGTEETSLISPPAGANVNLGWEISSTLTIINRDYIYQADPIGSTGFPLLQIPAFEIFSNVSSQTITTSETDLYFGQVNRTNTGAADPSLYPVGPDFNEKQRQSASYTPSQYVYYSSGSLGFDPARLINGIYRPTIVCTLLVRSVLLTGSPTTMTVKVYVNGTLLGSVTGTLTLASANFAFSIKGVGSFTTFRPPNNNPSDNYEGWANPPQIRVTASVNTGTASVLSVTLQDFVLNYPF